MKPIEPGMRVKYFCVNLWQQGLVEAVSGKFCDVRWDAHPFASTREWTANLCPIVRGEQR